MGELVVSQHKASDQDGFVLYVDGTVQWVNVACFSQLIATAGIESRHADWTSEIQPLPSASGRYTCTELQVLLSGG